MKLRLRLSHKVLLVIAIPLVLQLVFLGLVTNKLAELDRAEQSMKRSTEILLLRDRIYMDINEQMCLIGICLGTHDHKYQTMLSRTIGDLSEKYDRFCDVFRNDPPKKAVAVRLWTMERATMSVLKILLMQGPAHKLSQILIGQSNADIVQATIDRRFQAPIEGLVRSEIANQSEKEDRIIASNAYLLNLLLIGMGSSLLCCLGGGLYFTNSISSRLKIILSNIRAIERNTFELQKAGGRDEIGILDRTVRNTASELKQAIELHSDRVQLIAEELERPLADLSSYLRLLREDGFEELNEKGRSRLDKSAPEISRLRRIVNELALMNTVDTADLDLTMQKVDLADVAKTAIDIVGDLAQSRKIELKSELVAVHVPADQNRLIQVVVNLLSNAIKFSPDGSVVLIKISLSDSCAEISVTDQGAGIDESFKDKVFMKFEQSAHTESSSISGSGLGLAICKRIIEEQGGVMGFDSTLGRGSTFWIRLQLSGPGTFQPHGSTRAEAGKSWRPTLWKQGFALIALPLIVQFATFGTLYLCVKSINDNVIGLSRASNIASMHARIVANVAAGLVYAVLYNINQEQDTKDRTVRIQRELQKSAVDLDNLVDADNSHSASSALRKIIQEKLKLQDDIMSAPPDADVDRWFGKKNADATESIMFLTDQPVLDAIQHEEQLIGNRALASAQTQRLLNTLLLWSAIVSGVVSSSLALFMVQRLSKRIDAVVEDCVRISFGAPLEQPLDGDDELAFVDQCLHDAGHELHEIAETRHQMVSVASHELRTPLSSLSALIDLVEAGVFGSLTARGEQLARQIKRTISDLIAMITQLLDLDKMQSGKQLVHKDPCSLNNIVCEVAANVSSIARERQIDVRTEQCPVEVDADARRLIQALTCIVREFVNLLPANCAVDISCQSNRDTASIKIVTPNESALDLEAQRSVHGARQRVAVEFARAIVQQHGGQMIMRSRQLGRVVTIELPVPPASDNACTVS